MLFLHSEIARNSMQRLSTILAVSLIFVFGAGCNAQSKSLATANQLAGQRNWNGLAQFSVDWVKREPNNYDAWCDLAVASAHQNRVNDAIAAFKRASEINPTSPGVWHALAQVYSQSNNLDAAYNALSQGEQNCSGAGTMNSHYWYIFGNDFAVLERYDRAKQDLHKAIAGNPQFGAAWSNLGLQYEITNDDKTALSCYQKAAALGDNSGRYNAQTLQSRINAKNARTTVSRSGNPNSARDLLRRRLLIDCSPH
jgi:tetratricopeptide (TPR) repeat protein